MKRTNDGYRDYALTCCIAAALMLGACTTAPKKTAAETKRAEPAASPAPANYTPPCAQPGLSAYECDRRSILAMAGEYRVHFAFDETAALAPGYAPHAAQRSGGTELVLVIADTGEHISLQHILVLGDKHAVVKHWRQDWQYQPPTLLRFRGTGKFETETVAADTRTGAWSQTVYEVDDAPRYAGIGRWTHANGVDAWQSDRTWRPLPRREYTQRKDYQVLEVVNRHTLTPAGWVHEQDNTKLAIDANGTVYALARETGTNSYTRIADYDFGAGRDYWNRTRKYWSDVRAAWQRLEDKSPRFVTAPEPDGEARIDELFELAERIGSGDKVDGAAIDAVLARYVRATP
ncbi:MAG: hypothetical protein QM741_11035 [Rudaea sp.]|uniref:DUF6607 family protein n=1 Tax=Rudaea sp. TaxID=2136325 RepID=UPI0039E6B0CD